MGRILIIGHDDDLCCRLVREHLEAAGRSVSFLPENRLFPDLDFSWHAHTDPLKGSVGYQGDRVPFSEIDGVLSRGYGIPVNRDEYATKDGRYVCAEWNALAVAWLWKLPCRVCNRVRPELWYMTQLSAAQLAPLLGERALRSIQTLATTRQADLRLFVGRSKGRPTFSPFGHLLNYRVDDPERLTQIETLGGTLPFQLLDVPTGECVSAYIVGDRVFFSEESAAVPAPAIDAVSGHCTALCARLGLIFCRLDLIAGDDGLWYARCVDRMPHLYDVEEKLRILICQAIAGYLGDPLGNG